ncbi:MAG: ribosome recycling factor [Actinobacteria bacterium]|nr:ribosome recycling factor [Actinomycetota bacterium]MCL6088395.1 ribosome recycling factor [Actinomycetota bacterium]
MAATIDKIVHEFNAIRTGRASVSLLDRVLIDYYGTKTPVKHISNINLPEPKTIVISPYEPKFLKDIEKQILASDLGLNPSNDGKVIRLSIPPLNEERRRELVKVVKKIAEEGRVAIRNIRRDGIEDFKKLEKKAEITEDDLEILEKEMQDLTDEYIEKINRILAQKESEIMEV